uniref:hypothetical protein n=1 Tax=Scandinavium goeteborgense TaxID=1851514 RepID=UPI00135B86BC|nr:hypothetical protein [Scandinavium goeteborgense]
MLIDDAAVDPRLRGIWYRIYAQGTYSSISLDDIKSLAEEKNICILELKEVDFGYDALTKGVLIKTHTGSAIFPRVKATEVDLHQQRIAPTKSYENYWRHIDWFLPPYITNGSLNDAFERSGVRPKNFNSIDSTTAQERFEFEFPSLYPLSLIIPVTIQNLPKSAAIGKHMPIIKEAILAFYSGMKVAAIAALIPIIEDILRTIVGENGNDLDNISNINKCFNNACRNALLLDIHKVDWIPAEYSSIEYLKINNERIFMMETLRAWLLNSFYANTDNYNKHSGFNRHHFAHALSDIWQNQTNFFRAIGLIQGLAFVECFSSLGNNMSIFVPTANEASKSFHAEVISCIHTQQAKKIILNRYQIDNELPFNATASDDGWLLRACILSEKMNDIVITQLRNAGWQCHSFGDPVREGEYITVEAKKNDKNIRIALVYSFSVSREVYTTLGEHYDYILCQGTSYHADEYTSHLECIALPLNAWLVPESS